MFKLFGLLVVISVKHRIQKKNVDLLLRLRFGGIAKHLASFNE